MLPEQVFNRWKQKINKRDIYTFMTAVVVGFLTHMRIFVHDIPNHDGMSSLFFDQNMITSGRWFLRVACGISSDYTLPWVIGVLCVLYLALTAVFLQRFLDIKHTFNAMLLAAILVVYPSLASNFAYIFTADGYMLALFLAVLSVYLVERSKLGFVWGAIALGFSMGIYQAYISFAMILAVYAICRAWFLRPTGKGSLGRTIHSEEVKNNWGITWRYVAMGGMGAAIYYIMLQVLLFVQQTGLSGYQGIGEGNQKSLLDTIVQIYRDFVIHTLRGNIMMQKGLLTVVVVVLVAAAAVVLFRKLCQAGSLKSIWTYLCGAVSVIVLPVCFNAILLISPEVNYHSLMRYQWVLIPMMAVVIIDRHGEDVFASLKGKVVIAWLGVIASVVIAFQYGVICNIGYFNLEKKFEKTYSYCLRLLEQMEETEGYYHGMPIAMIGVVGDDYLPSTDLTVGITDSLIGVNGDYLFYTAENYKLFMKYYFGVTLELVPIDDMVKITQTPEYKALNTFPKESSMKVVDNILYIKLENQGD
ncbi:MAG: glucosyltransferase domain-containing protein [Lachnospiraceae bacterium]|nr:glucosyltransferase domain-containing protein [Lachnospiraceae bacterium]